MSARPPTPRASVRAALGVACVACVTLFTSVAAPPLRAQSGSQGIPATIAKMQQLCGQNRFMDAARLGEQLVKEHRDSLDAWLALATVNLAPDWPNRRDARAESAARKALALGGHRPDIVQALATALYRQCKFDECLQLVDELIETRPQKVFGDAFADLLFLRAGIALRRDALDAAAHARGLADLDHALVTAPCHAAARRMRAEAYLTDGKVAEALADLEVAVVNAPGDKSVHYEMHRCLSRLKRPDEAKLHYEIWKRINALTDSTAPTNAPDLKERLDLLKQLKELNPGDYSRRLQLAEHEIALGDADAAVKECDEILAKRPAWAAAEHLRAEALRAKAGAKPDLPNSQGDDGGVDK
jgi:tetratricopeptide (TPR) repeat protein